MRPGRSSPGPPETTRFGPCRTGDAQLLELRANLLNCDVGVDDPDLRLWYALPANAARLDALVALKERSLVERDVPPLLQPGTYLEPFAMRALGAVREDDLLIEQAVDLFAELGLESHAEQSRRLLAPT